MASHRPVYDRCAVDLVWSLIKAADEDEDGAHIEGLDQLPLERFGVVIPLVGLQVEISPTIIGGVRVVNRAHAAEVVNGAPQPLDEAGDIFLGSSETFALVNLHAFTMHDAQQEACRRVDVLAAFLTSLGRFSYVQSPGRGLRSNFDHDDCLLQIYRGQYVAVRGEATGRAWLRHAFDNPRQTSVGPDSSTLDLAQHLDVNLAELPPALQMLLRFTARASQSSPLHERVVILWQALEFYAASTDVPDVFDGNAQNALRYHLRKVRAKLSPKQVQRLNDATGSLNRAPLMAKLREQLRLDGVPVSEFELSILGFLRSCRNDIVHGKSVPSMSAAQVNQGISIAARIAAFALHRHEQG